MDLQGIKSRDMSVEELFSDFYEVPNYQREFVWGSEQIELLLADIFAEFTEKSPNYNPDYFIGSIVTRYRVEDGIYELVDGQQRVTTLYVALCAIRDYLIEHESQIEAIDGQLYSLMVDDDLVETRRPRVTLQYDDDQDVLLRLAEKRDHVPLEKIVATQKSAVNLMTAYRDTRAFLMEELEDSPKAVGHFYLFLTKNVKLIRIRTETIDRALWIFETINQRGLGLDAMDLLKNLLFRNAKEDQFGALKKRWKLLVGELYSAREKPMSFIRHFLLADYASGKILADRIYAWLTNKNNLNRPDYESDPLGFADELLSAARSYVGFAAGRLPDGSTCRYLTNITHLHHTAKQHLILMMAARRLPAESLCDLAREVENLYFVYTITRQSPNKFEALFVDWAIALRQMKTPAELQTFLDETLVPTRTMLAPEFVDSLRRLGEQNLRKYSMKYVLGKLAQYLDESAYGTEFDLPVYVDPKVDIEHILPVAASMDAIDDFGGAEAADRCLHRLANLTPLERSLNAIVSNKPFPEKVPGYAESKFLLTKGMAPDVRVGKDNKINEALKHVGVYDVWDTRTFKDREDRLVGIAQIVWGTQSSDDKGH